MIINCSAIESRDIDLSKNPKIIQKYFFIMEKNDFENFHFRKKKRFWKFSAKFKKSPKILDLLKNIANFWIWDFLGANWGFSIFAENFQKTFFSKMKIFKIIFLHDEKIFFTRIFFYDLEYVSRVQANTMQRPGQFTALPTARKLIMFFFCIKCSLETLLESQLGGSSV